MTQEELDKIVEQHQHWIKEELLGGRQMRELKVYHHELRHNEYEEFYLKYEADKVIAEKNKEIKRLENLCESYRIDCDNLAIREANAYKEIGRDNKKIRHQKYKRCLAMASWCCDACDKWMMRKAKAIGLGKEGVKEYHQARSKLFLYMRWQMRWIKIAEQFKEAK